MRYFPSVIAGICILSFSTFSLLSVDINEIIPGHILKIWVGKTFCSFYKCRCSNLGQRLATLTVNDITWCSGCTCLELKVVLMLPLTCISEHCRTNRYLKFLILSAIRSLNVDMGHIDESFRGCLFLDISPVILIFFNFTFNAFVLFIFSYVLPHCL